MGCVARTLDDDAKSEIRADPASRYEESRGWRQKQPEPTSRPSRFRIWPFRIIAKASKPAKVLRAVRKQPKPSPGLNQALDAPVVLLDDVVEIFALPHASSAPEFAVSLHVYDCPWISGVLVDREGARVHYMRLHERPAKEPLRRHRISPSRQQKSIVCPRLSTAR